jgi:hypothetical protein
MGIVAGSRNRQESSFCASNSLSIGSLKNGKSRAKRLFQNRQSRLGKQAVAHEKETRKPVLKQFLTLQRHLARRVSRPAAQTA